MQNRPAPIETPQLELVTLLADEIRALISGDTARAGDLAGAVFPTTWPPGEADATEGFTWHLEHLETEVRQLGWHIRIIVERGSRLVVGSVNLEGPPDDEGDVEIGWGIDPGFRRRGYASEAALAVARWAEAQDGVTSLTATIPRGNTPSERVAARIGMAPTEERRRDLPLWRRTVAGPGGPGSPIPQETDR